MYTVVSAFTVFLSLDQCYCTELEFFISYQYCKCDIIGLIVIFLFEMLAYFSAVKKKKSQAINYTCHSLETGFSSL